MHVLGSVNLQCNFCPPANMCKWVKLKKKSLPLKNQPGCSARGGTEGSSRADVHPSRLGNGQASLWLGLLVVGSLQQGTSVPASILSCHLTDLVWTANNQQLENLPRIGVFQAQWLPCAKARWGPSRSLCESFLLGLFCFEWVGCICWSKDTAWVLLYFSWELKLTELVIKLSDSLSLH